MARARGFTAVLISLAMSAATVRAQEAPAAPPATVAAPAPVAAPGPSPAPYGGPPPAYPPGYVPWTGNPDPYGGAPSPFQLMAFEDGKKNPGIALLLELVVAGVGSLYADHPQGALITWGGMLGGVVLLVVGIDHYHWQLDDGTASQAQVHPDNGGAVTLMVAGAITMFGFRIYGLVDSWQSANDFNRNLAKRLGLPAFSATVAPLPTDRGLAWGPALQLRF